LPLAVFSGDTKKQARMLQYFLSNPKSAAMPAVIGVFYNFINKLLLAHYSPANFQEDRKLGIWSHHRKLAGQIPLSTIHRCLVLLEEYSHKTVGVDSMQSAPSLLKEMTGKMMILLFQAR
jgi:DNA polymerase-3 subunit delta